MLTKKQRKLIRDCSDADYFNPSVSSARTELNPNSKKVFGRNPIPNMGERSAMFDGPI